MVQKESNVHIDDFSDIDNDVTIEDYKGFYFKDRDESYQDPITGCHFQYEDLYKRLRRLKK